MKQTTGAGHLHVKKGDTVIILSGKDRGEVGTVQAAFPSTGKLTVEGRNMVTRHQKPRRDTTFGAMQQGLVQKPAGLDGSKVMLQCPHCHKGTRPHRAVQPGGLLARVCKKCGKVID
jgi:large subunit ribosomal protein L24